MEKIAMHMKDTLVALNKLRTAERHGRPPMSTTQFAASMGWGRAKAIRVLDAMQEVGWIETSSETVGAVTAHRHKPTWRGIVLLALHSPAQAHTMPKDDKSVRLAAGEHLPSLDTAFGELPF
jgi:hypothetical protein